MRRLNVPCLLAVLLILTSTGALAQHGHGDEGSLQFDPAVAPLVLPAGDDFLPPPGDDPATLGFAPAPVAVGAYVDVTSELKLFTFVPSYTFAQKLALKVRVPWIFERKLEYFEHEATASGLGDVAIDAEYTHRFARPGRALRFMASVKLPTGDDEKMDDDDYLVPLGTGSTDILARAQYAQSTPRTGLLASLLYRRNTATETTSQYIDPLDPTSIQTTTSRVTNGHQFVGAAFARQRLNERLWLHLGASLMVTGDGKAEFEWRVDNDTTNDEFALGQKATLVDLFPGVSYRVGPVMPYLGVRVPVVTSYDDDFREESRSTAVIFQLSYRPERLY